MLEKWKRDGGPFSSYICEKAESVWKEIEFGIRNTVEVIPYFVSVWIITTLHKKNSKHGWLWFCLQEKQSSPLGILHNVSFGGEDENVNG